MRLGVIARSEDRGLGNQTWEVCRHLSPERVLLVEPSVPRWPLHPERYAGYETTRAQWLGTDEGLEEHTIRPWLQGLDVVYSAETLYDWRIPSWFKGRAVVHANPELLLPQWRTADVVWWSATPWRLEHMPTGTRVVPMPVATERFGGTPPTAAERTRFLHIAGHLAMMDRNGTRLVAAAAHQLGGGVEVIVSEQDRSSEVNLRHCTRRSAVADYWRLYDDADVLVMPRRFGGLCLPIQEAAAAGLAIISTDCSPNEVYPGVHVPVAERQHVRMAGGNVEVASCSEAGLLAAMRAVCERSQLERLQQTSLEWAAEHSWERGRYEWSYELMLASSSPSAARARTG